MTVTVIDDIEAAGFDVLGGLAPEPDDGVPTLDDGRQARFVILVGNAGPRMFSRFVAARDPARDTLDRWCEDMLRPIARNRDMRALFPWQKPYLPFQKWAARAGAGRPSPLGMNIHPVYGLWYGFRAAFVSGDPVRLPEPAASGAHPCDGCVDKPCLSACPVDAFVSGRDMPFNPDACVKYLRDMGKKTCLVHGCSARLACPAGKNHAYSETQIRFHLNAFFRSRTEE